MVEDKVNLESLLSLESTREKESKKMGEELLQLLSRPTAKERNLIERFRSVDGGQVQEFCARGTKNECIRLSVTNEPCEKLHFKKIIQKHTDESLGDCSFLNTCFHMDTCKYVHYRVDYSTVKSKTKTRKEVLTPQRFKYILFPPQWLSCDLRYFDMTILGKFAVVMADPPWNVIFRS
jgi:mRNA (2'-O-methyladenosine-N6-)-methyltransferase